MRMRDNMINSLTRFPVLELKVRDDFRAGKTCTIQSFNKAFLVDPPPTAAISTRPPANEQGGQFFARVEGWTCNNAHPACHEAEPLKRQYGIPQMRADGATKDKIEWSTDFARLEVVYSD